MAVWQPIASMVTIQPLMASKCRRSGMVVISLDLLSVFSWPTTTPPMVGTPRREHVQGGGRGGAVKGGFHRFAIEGDQGTLRGVRDGAGPGQKAFLKALRIEARKAAAKGVVGRNPVGQGEEGLQP